MEKYTTWTDRFFKMYSFVRKVLCSSLKLQTKRVQMAKHLELLKRKFSLSIRTTEKLFKDKAPPFKSSN